MKFLTYIFLIVLLCGCGFKPQFRPTKMYSGNENKNESDFSLIYIDWMETAQIYKKVGQTEITEINNIKVAERVPTMGSKYMLQVLPGEQNVSIFLFFIKEYIGMDMYKTESVTLKLPPFNTQPNKIYVLCPQKSNGLNFKVKIYPYTRQEILEKKGMTDFIVRPCRTMDKLSIQ
ncbi:hypothetical protein MO859_17575 [Acinetobacter baumannii]|uniref:hypothetical protein n=1 Tax=Acinetobacter baumannii TaxID=470 RepID=UPI001F58065D|nr:hypothetical protein [Acinetobacter baumannii]MCI2319550.1 hypothetical protein [Acinetobacter baumannii]